jgi:uracil-DNA glycosylase family 4
MTTELCFGCPYKDSNRCGISPEFVGGNTPTIIFVGESPANDEREALRPFVGMFGGLLRQMIRQYNTNNEPYMLMNLSYCVPDDRYESNRAVGMCRHRTLDIIKQYPDAKLVALGSLPTQVLSGRNKVSEVDGTWVHHDGRDVLCLSIAFINNLFAFPAFQLGFEKAFKPVEYPYIPNPGYVVLTPGDYYSWGETDDWGDIDGDVAIDIETTGFDFTRDSMLSVGIGIEDNIYILSTRLLEIKVIKNCLWKLWDNPDVRIGFHNGGNFDLPWLMYTFGLPYRLDWDTLLMHYSFQESGVGSYTGDYRDNASKGHGLKMLSRRYLNLGHYEEGVTFNPQNEHDWNTLHKYLAIDVWSTLQLKKLFDKKIQEGV